MNGKFELGILILCTPQSCLLNKHCTCQKKTCGLFYIRQFHSLSSDNVLLLLDF